jgi:hypothetical protein
MSLFSCLQDSSNGIVRGDGWLVQCPYNETDSYIVADELRNVRTFLQYCKSVIREFSVDIIPYIGKKTNTALQRLAVSPSLE